MNVCHLWAFGPLDQMSLFCRHICFALKADFFIEALRLRLLVAPFFNPEMRSCSMCHGVLIRDSPFTAWTAMPSRAGGTGAMIW